MPNNKYNKNDQLGDERDEIGFLQRYSREEHNYGCHEKKLRKSFGELQ